jgi:hypothetical protein
VRSEISSTWGRKSATCARLASPRRLSQGESCAPPEKKASRPAKATPRVNPSPRRTVVSAHGSYTPLRSSPAATDARRSTAAATATGAGRRLGDVAAIARNWGGCGFLGRDGRGPLTREGGSGNPVRYNSRRRVAGARNKEGLKRRRLLVGPWRPSSSCRPCTCNFFFFC